MLWFTSDLHIGHQAILQMENRPYNNIDEMNHQLIENINCFVKERDTLYILGDLSYRVDIQEVEKWIRKIKCKNLYLIKGNHDKDYSPKLFKDIQDILVIKENHQKIVLMHYPLLEWPHYYHGAIHLHGHIHSNEIYNYENRKNHILRYDVGVDANQYCPVSLEQIIEFFKCE